MQRGSHVCSHKLGDKGKALLGRDVRLKRLQFLDALQPAIVQAQVEPCLLNADGFQAQEIWADADLAVHEAVRQAFEASVCTYPIGLQQALSMCFDL